MFARAAVRALRACCACVVVGSGGRLRFRNGATRLALWQADDAFA